MKVNVGIIGCGAIVQRAYLPGFSQPDSELSARAMRGHMHNGCEDSSIVALADVNEKLAQNLAKEYQVPKVFKDWEELINEEDIDAVCVATPNYLHAEMTLAALNAGKHVLVEKPMALQLDDLDKMIQASERQKVILMVNHSFRFSPIYEKAKEIIDSGLIGEIYSIRGRFGYAGPEHWTGSPSTWFLDKSMAGGGALFDAGIHAVDLIRYLVGKEVNQVAGLMSTLQKEIDAEDNAICIFSFQDGSLGTIEASWTTRPGEIITQIYGSEGNMSVDMSEGSASISENGANPIIVFFAPPKTTYMNMSMPDGSLKIPVFLPDIPTNSKNGGPFRHFINCIKNKSDPISSGTDARKSMEILFAAIKSNQSEQFINLPLSL